MSLKEKVAYLKGLSEGLGFDSESKEGKMFSGIIDALSAMADEVEELSENALDIGEELDALSNDLSDVEELLFDDDYDDDDDDDFDFGDFEDDDCDCEFCAGHDFSLEIECPNCGADIELSEDDLTSGSTTCAVCGETLELEFDDEEEVQEEVPF